MIESFDSRFVGDGKGSSDRRSEAEMEQKRSKMEINPETPVLHVLGSEHWHLYRQCPKLKEEERGGEQEDELLSRPATHAIGRLFGEMKELNRRVQQNEIHPSVRLNDTGKLELCPECDEKRNKAVPKRALLDSR